MKEKILLRSRAKRLNPIVRIGKNGLNENTVKEIEKILVKRGLIKIKLLKPSFKPGEKELLIENLVKLTNSQLIDSVGNIVVIYKTSKNSHWQ